MNLNEPDIISRPYLFANIPFLSVLHRFGWIGVDLFFALSAFLFTKLLIIEYTKTRKIDFKKFYIRRIFRIWPIYYLFLGLTIFLYIFFKGSLSGNLITRIIGFSAFIDNIFTAIEGYSTLPFTSHLWTISYEEQFYVFIPLIIFFLARVSPKYRLIFFLMVLILFNGIRIVMIYLNVPHPAIWVLPVTHFESIIFGIVIGFGGVDFLLSYTKPILTGIIGVLFFLLLSLLPGLKEISYILIINYTVVGISTSLVLFAVINSKILNKLFSFQPFVYLGKRSYGLYVYHLLANSVAGKLLPNNELFPSHSLMLFLLSLIITIAISIFSYKFIEKPFLKMKKKFEVIISRPV